VGDRASGRASSDEDVTETREEQLAGRLRVAAELFAARGYGGTTTRELASAMGVTNGTFYHHFESKEALLRLVCLQALRTLEARVQAAVERADEPLQKLEVLVQVHIAAITADRHAHVTMLTDTRSLQGDQRHEIIEARDRYERRVREVIGLGQRRGVLRDDIETATTARLLLNLLNWTIVWFSEQGAVPEEDLSKQMLTVFLDGARA